MPNNNVFATMTNAAAISTKNQPNQLPDWFNDELQPGKPFDLENILKYIETLKGPQYNLEDKTIAAALNAAAENFKDHDFFSIARIDNSSTTATSTANEEETSANHRLMENWERWYTYKIIYYYFSKEHFTEIDLDLIDKSSKHSALDQLAINISYKNIISTGRSFYEDQLNLAKNIFQQLSKNKDMQDIASRIHALSEAED